MPLSLCVRVEPFDQLARRVGLGAHGEKDVGPVERAHEHARLGAEQPRGDVGAGRRVGGRRHREGLRIAERRGGLAQAQIFGAEVVAPLRDAMGFVDGEQIDRAPQHFERVVAQQPLGRDIEQPQRAVA